MARKTKEESQRTRDRILDAAEHVFMSKGWPTPPWATSPTTPACPGCRLRPLQEQDRCLRRHERPRAGRGRGADRVRTDGKALESLYASMLQYVRIYSEEGSMQRVLEILYDKCEQSDENAPLLRRRDIWERHALRNSEKLLRAAVRNEDLPGALDVRLSNVYLHSLIEGCSAASAGPIA